MPFTGSRKKDEVDVHLLNPNNNGKEDSRISLESFNHYSLFESDHETHNKYELIDNSDESSLKNEKFSTEKLSKQESRENGFKEFSSDQKYQKPHLLASSKSKNSKKSQIPSNVKNKEQDLEILSKYLETKNIEPENKVHKIKNDQDLLCIDFKMLNPDNEMRRIFGRSTIFEESNNNNNNNNLKHKSTKGIRGNKRLRVNNTRKFLLVKPSNKSARLKNDGLQLKVIREHDGISYYSYSWTKEYQIVQNKFFKCVESSDPDNLFRLHHQNPYHVDTMLQLYQTLYIMKNYDEAKSILEMLLCRLEISWPTDFRSLMENQIRLEFNIEKNRSFFLALLYQIQFVSRRGLSQTAFELSKFVLNLDPSDPLGLFYQIDIFLLRKDSLKTILDFSESPLSVEHDFNTKINWRYSKALALFLLEKSLSLDKWNSPEYKKYSKLRCGSSELLRETILTFPLSFVLLLKKNSINSIMDDKGNDVLGLPLFQQASTGIHNAYVLQSHLYAERATHFWKTPAVIKWLKECALEIYSIAKNESESIRSKFENKLDHFKDFTSTFAPGSLEILNRHVLLCEYDDIKKMLSPEILQKGFQIYENDMTNENVTINNDEDNNINNENNNGSLPLDALYDMVRSISYAPLDIDTDFIDQLAQLSPDDYTED